jgi:hypothetical protein
MTGLYPPAHGVVTNGNYTLGPEAVTLAERLGGAAIALAAFRVGRRTRPRYGLDQDSPR